MRDVERLERSSAQHRAFNDSRMALYDQYGSLAYGIILRILQEPERAQQVLVNLFASPQLTEFSGGTAVIIRMARQMAIEARSDEPQHPAALAEELPAPAHLPMLVFDLSFCQGYTLQTIAGRLQLTYADAVKAIRDHFANFRTYHHQR